MIVSALSILALSSVVSAHGDHSQQPIAGPHRQLWYNTLPGDGGTQVRRSRAAFAHAKASGQEPGARSMRPRRKLTAETHRPIRCFQAFRRSEGCRITPACRATKNDMTLLSSVRQMAQTYALPFCHESLWLFASRDSTADTRRIVGTQALPLTRELLTGPEPDSAPAALDKVLAV